MTHLSIEPFELPLSDPLTSAAGTIESRRGVLVRYGRGIGEATPLVPWTEPYEETHAALSALVDAPRPIGEALAQLADTPAARHGLALAVADHHATDRGVGLYRHLGGQTACTSVPVNATVDADTPAAVAEAGRDIEAAGYRAVKLKIDGTDPADAIARAEALRTAVGDAVALRLDANASWTPAAIRSAAPSLAAVDPAYLEQPTAGIDRELIADLADAGLAVALDEAVVTEGIGPMLTSEAAVAVIKPMALGGPDRAVATARAARTCGLIPVVSDLVTGAVARTGGAHVAAALGAQVPSGLDTGRRLRVDLVDDAPTVTDGRLAIPSGAGLGLGEVRVPDD